MTRVMPIFFFFSFQLRHASRKQMACHPSKCVKACPPAPPKPNKFINLAGHLIVTKLHESIKSNTTKFQLPFMYKLVNQWAQR